LPISAWLFFSTAISVCAAPHVSIVLENTTIRINKPFDLSINVSWDGDADEYIIAPPELELPEGVEKISSSFISSARLNTHLIKYRYILKAQKKGAVTLTPVQIKYWGTGSKQESVVSTEEVSFNVVLFTFLGLN